MKWLAIMLLLGIGFKAHAEATSAADYFNLGAATFIREDPEAAKAIVEEGLLFHPEDEPLLKLKALLEQQQESQSNQSDQSEKSEQPQESDQSDQSDQQPQDQPQESESPQDQPQDQPQPEEMTGEEAEMVLDSLRQLEEAQRDQLMQEMIRRQMRDMPPVEKDW